MRILHTADWHLGRTLEGRSRRDEQEAVLEEICRIAEDEGVHLVVVAGDAFDSVNPPAWAEELFYEAVDRLAAGGRRAVLVLSGNHDSPERLCAASPLAGRHGITLLGLPGVMPPPNPAADRACRVAAGPGWVEIAVPGVEHAAVVAALPYPSEARLGEVLRQSLQEETLQAAYSERVGRLLHAAARRFRADTVNLVTSHLFVAGGMESESERPIQLGGAYTVLPEAFPAGAHYVALGHLHRPQVVRAAAPARYSGSPLAYSFSEAGQSKAVFVVEAVPGAPAAVREIPLRAGRPLVRWRATEGIAQVYRWIEGGRDPEAWIDLEVHLTHPLGPDQIQRLRALRPRLLSIRPVFDAAADAGDRPVRRGVPVHDLFRQFYRRERGHDPDDAVVRLFQELVLAAERDAAVGAEAEAAVAREDGTGNGGGAAP